MEFTTAAADRRVKPAVTGTTHRLPFLDLDALSFERLCLWVASAEGYREVAHHGATGTDGGRDVIARDPEGHVWYFQCKRQTRVSAAALIEELDKIRARDAAGGTAAEGVIFALASDASDRLRSAVTDYAAERNLRCVFWARSELDLLVKRHPEIVAEFFQISGSAQNAPPALSRVWNVPRRNPNFTGRAAILRQLRGGLVNRRYAAITQTISGLGGVGKTQIAIEYAHTYRSEYHQVWWVPAEEAHSIDTSFEALSRALGVELPREADQQILIAAVRQWLQQHDHWLLIFDNADGPILVRRYLPAHFRGHVLITSRNPNWRGDARVLPVPVFARPSSVRFLMKRSGQRDRTGAHDLAEELGDLPLALDQAAAYVEQTGRSLREYRRLFETRRSELLALGPMSPDYPASVATTWDISIHQIRLVSEAAVNLLDICAYFAPVPIPISLFLDGLADVPGQMASTLTDPLHLDSAIAHLRQFSLVDGVDGISVHRLVQAVVRDQHGESAGLWVGLALALARKAFPTPDVHAGDWWREAPTLPHALSAARHACRVPSLVEQAYQLLSDIALHLRERGALAEAEQLFDEARILGESTWGQSDARLITVLTYLGSTIHRRGRLDDARRLHERALELAEATHAPAELVQTILTNLSGVIRDSGDLVEAARMQGRALVLAEQRGDDEMLGALLNNIGSRLLYERKTDEALTYLKRAEPIIRRVPGPGTPMMATCLGNLAVAHMQQGNHQAALSLLQEAVSIDQDLFGPEHPNLTYHVMNLGVVYEELGDAERARANLLWAERLILNNGGPQHFLYARLVVPLARAHMAGADFSAAKSCLEAAYRARPRGRSDEDDLEILSLLGQIEDQEGHLERAIHWYEQAAATQGWGDSSRGLLHRSLNALADLYFRHGAYARSKETAQRAAALASESASSEAPDLALTYALLGQALVFCGEDEEAKRWLNDALQKADGPKGLGAFRASRTSWLAGVALRRTGELDAARTSIEQALAWLDEDDREHLDKDAYLATLGEVLIAAGEYEDAAGALEQQLRSLERSPQRIGWRIDALTRLGTVLVYLGKLDLARQRLRNAEEALVGVEAGDNDRRVERAETLYRWLGATEVLWGNFSEAMRYLGQAASVTGETDEETFAKLIDHLTYLGALTKQRSKDDVSWRACTRVLQLARDDDPRVPGIVIAAGQLMKRLGGAVWDDAAHLSTRGYLGTAIGACITGLRVGQTVTDDLDPTVLVTGNALLGSILDSAGDSDGALAADRRAVDLLDQLARPDPALEVRVRVHLASVLERSGNWDAAKAELERVLAIDERTYGRDHLEVAVDLTLLGGLHARAGNADDAQDLHNRALALKERHLGPTGALLQADLLALGQLAQEAGALDQARDLLERALHTDESDAAWFRLERLAVLERLGDVLRDLRQLDEARSVYLRTLDVPDVPPDQRARLLNSLGAVEWSLNDLPAARDALEDALSLQEEVRGGDHPSVAIALGNLANVLKALGDLGRAEECYDRALAIDEAEYGSTDARLVYRLLKRGSLSADRGLFRAAVPYFERAVRIASATPDQDGRAVLFPLELLAKAFVGDGDLAAAISTYDRLIDTAQSAGAEASESFRYRLAQADLYLRRNDWVRARDLLEHVLEEATVSTSASPDVIVLASRRLAIAANELGDRQSARAHLLSALGICGKTPDHAPEPLASVTHDLASVLVSLDDPAGAIGALSFAIHVLTSSTHDAPGPRLGQLLRFRASLFLTLGDLDSARADIDLALEHDRRNEDTQAVAQDLLTLAQTHLRQRDIGVSLGLAERALEILATSPTVCAADRAIGLQLIGVALLDGGVVAHSRAYLRRALQVLGASSNHGNSLAGEISALLAILDRSEPAGQREAASRPGDSPTGAEAGTLDAS